MLKSIDFAPLRKVLELERLKGYSDTAVIGGLDRFLKNWRAKTGKSITSPKINKLFKELQPGDFSYAALGLRQRQAWIDSVINFITKDGKSESAAKIPSPTRTNTGPRVFKTPSYSEKRRSPTVKSPLGDPVTVVKGISETLAKKFHKLGVKTVRDLLYLFPNRHLDYSQKKHISQLVAGEEQTIVAHVWEARVTMPGGRRSTEATLGDETGNVRAVWFNNPYLAKTLAVNSRVVISGRVSIFHGRPVFESPEWEFAEEEDLTHTGRLVPLYPLTAGLHPRQVRRLMKQFLDRWIPQVTDFLPPELLLRDGLLELPEAISQAHYPVNAERKDRARVRLAFDELFLLQLGVIKKKRDWQQSQPGHPFNTRVPLPDTFLRSLPFKLTSAQRRVLDEILADLQKSLPMSRLLQGDVGSGKTVVATAALLVAAANGYQGAFMAPTEILAEQHFQSISEMLSRLAEKSGEGPIYRFSGLLPHPLTLALLVGDAKQFRKQELHRQILEGDVDIAIGTHALIQKGVEFRRLGLAVVDEQHRFGVEQRSALRQKGFNPHMLVMTATPIPRTLALTLYGDLDLSVIDELPPGRQMIKTKWLEPAKVDSAYNFIRRQVAEGHQAFIICPLIEESEAVQARAAVTEYERLSRAVFSDLRLGLLHGQMPAAEKDEVMRRFRSGELNIMVSTPVVEVGIDVPNATVMMVESADRFGLAQLHQFRGRVGRGPAQSYCILLAENPSLVGQQRLDIIESTQNGFTLAEADLNMRGPGEFFGTRQSGLPDLRMARLTDVALLELARREALSLFAQDPDLKAAKHRLLAQEMARVWKEAMTEWS